MNVHTLMILIFCHALFSICTDGTTTENELSSTTLNTKIHFSHEHQLPSYDQVMNPHPPTYDEAKSIRCQQESVEVVTFLEDDQALNEESAPNSISRWSKFKECLSRCAGCLTRLKAHSDFLPVMLFLILSITFITLALTVNLCYFIGFFAVFCFFKLYYMEKNLIN